MQTKLSRQKNANVCYSYHASVIPTYAAMVLISHGFYAALFTRSNAVAVVNTVCYVCDYA